MEWMECMVVYGSVWESTWVHINVFRVFVSVVRLCDCKEFLWLSWVYVSECEGYDCIWVYYSVCECYECIWVLYEHWTLYEQLCNFFRNHIQNFATLSTSVQTHPPRFRIPARTVTKIGLWNTPKSAGWWANFGISTSWPSLHTGHQRIYTNFNSTRRVVCDIGTKRCKRRDTHHYPCNPRRIKKIRTLFYEFMWVSWVDVTVMSLCECMLVSWLYLSASGVFQCMLL